MYITETKNVSDKAIASQKFIYELSDSVDEIVKMVNLQFDFIESKYGEDILDTIAKKYDDTAIKQRIKLCTDMVLDIQDRITNSSTIFGKFFI